MEEWRECAECPLYKVSSLGNIKSREHILKPWVLNNGYKCVSFCVDYVKKNFTIHTLVASAFLGERPDKLVVDHKDGNKLNNSVDNLQYITQSKNCIKGAVYRKRKTNTRLRHINHTIHDTYKLQIHRSGKKALIKTFKTLPEAIVFRDTYLSADV